MTERIRIADDPQQLSVAEWQRLDLGHPALRLEVLQAYANTSTHRSQLRLFLAEDAAGIAAAAVCELAPTLGGSNHLNALLYGRGARLARALPGVGGAALLCGSPISNYAGISFRSPEPAEQRRLLDVMLDALETYAVEQRLDLAFVGVTDDNERLLGALKARGYGDTEIQQTARMAVAWTNFEGYLADLKRRGASAAKTARNERNRNQKSGVVIRQIACGPGEAQALDTLVRGHYQHKNGKDMPFAPQLLPRMAELLGEDFLLFEAVRKGERVAMAGAVRAQSAAWMAWLGIEQRDRPNDFTYPNLAYYHMADTAAALGLKTQYYGTGALEAKRRRGCDIVVSHLLYRPRAAWVRALMQIYMPLHRAWYRRKLR